MEAAQNDQQLRNRLLTKLKARSDLYKKPIPLADICAALGLGVAPVEVQNLERAIAKQLKEFPQERHSDTPAAQDAHRSVLERNVLLDELICQHAGLKKCKEDLIYEILKAKLRAHKITLGDMTETERDIYHAREEERAAQEKEDAAQAEAEGN